MRLFRKKKKKRSNAEKIDKDVMQSIGNKIREELKTTRKVKIEVEEGIGYYKSRVIFFTKGIVEGIIITGIQGVLVYQLENDFGDNIWE